MPILTVTIVPSDTGREKLRSITLTEKATARVIGVREIDFGPNDNDEYIKVVVEQAVKEMVTELVRKERTGTTQFDIDSDEVLKKSIFG